MAEIESVVELFGSPDKSCLGTIEFLDVSSRTVDLKSILMDSLDLSEIAHQAMIDAGFVPDVPPSVLAALRSLESQRQTAVADSSTRDLRSLLWSSIDDRKSRDLDQVEYAERLPNGDICGD